MSVDTCILVSMSRRPFLNPATPEICNLKDGYHTYANEGHVGNN